MKPATSDSATAWQRRLPGGFASLVLLLTLVPLASEGVAEPHLLFLSSIRTRQVFVYSIDSANGTLEYQSAVKLPGTPGALAVARDGTRVYVALSKLRDGHSGVATIGFDEAGALVELAIAKLSSPASFIRLDPQENHLVVAHHDAGRVAVHRIVDGVCTDELVALRSTARTAHSIGFDRTGRYVFVPHTDQNRIHQFAFASLSGLLEPLDPPFVDGSERDGVRGTRHYAQHPTLDVGYTANEQGGGITRWRFDRNAVTLQRLETLSTLPPDFSGKSAAADIAITPDGRYAYVSNRDLTRRKRGDPMEDTIAAFSLAPATGALTSVGTFRTARFPRSLCIDATGRFLFVVGQQSNRLRIHPIRKRDGTLRRGARFRVAGQPNWVACGQ